MNGRAMWCPPARKRDIDFGPPPIEDKAALLAECPALIRSAIAKGLCVPGPDWNAPSSACQVCGKSMPMRKWAKKGCSLECRTILTARRKATPEKPCPICGQIFKPRLNGGKMTKSCSNKCGLVMMRNTQSETRKAKNENKTQ